MNARLPRCSVIIIFFNAERYLVDAIESVLRQTERDFELLLVDDGSSDRGTRIALCYAQSMPNRVRYLEHEGHANRGMSATRNLGIDHARGEFIAFIDADDAWRPTKLADQLEIMRRHPELGAVCGSVNYWRSWGAGEDAIVPTGHVQDQVVASPEAVLALYPLGKAAAPCPSDLLLRRNLVERLGGFEADFTGSCQMYEDQAFLAKLYLHAPIYFSSQVWLDYRRHGESIVEKVKADGRYNEVRSYFLEWLGNYLRHTGHDRDARVRRVWEQAVWTHRHPYLHTLKLLGSRARRRLAKYFGVRVRS